MLPFVYDITMTSNVAFIKNAPTRLRPTLYGADVYTAPSLDAIDEKH